MGIVRSRCAVCSSLYCGVLSEVVTGGRRSPRSKALLPNEVDKRGGPRSGRNQKAKPVLIPRKGRSTRDGVKASLASDALPLLHQGSPDLVDPYTLIFPAARCECSSARAPPHPPPRGITWISCPRPWLGLVAAGFGRRPLDDEGGRERMAVRECSRRRERFERAVRQCRLDELAIPPFACIHHSPCYCMSGQACA